MQHLDIIRSLPARSSSIGGLAWDGKNIWHSDGMAHRIFEIERDTGEMISALPMAGDALGLAFDGDCLWHVDNNERQLLKVDPISRDVVAALPIPKTLKSFGDLTWDGSDFWISTPEEGEIHRLSSLDASILQTIGVEFHIAGLAWFGGSLWCSDYARGWIIRLNPLTGERLQVYEVGGHPLGLAWDGRSLWYTDRELGQLCEVDLTTPRA